MKSRFDKALAEHTPEPGTRLEVFKRTYYLLPQAEQEQIAEICLRIGEQCFRMGPISALELVGELVGELGIFLVLKSQHPLAVPLK